MAKTITNQAVAESIEPQTLKPGLSLFDSVTLVAGSMIGSGIFIVSADISRQVGSPAALIAVWVVAGLMTIAGALAYGELAAMMPQAGGQYVYLREAYGGLVAFLFGWTLLLIVQTGTVAAVAVAFARFSGVIFPQIKSELWIGIGGVGLSGERLARDRGDRVSDLEQSARAPSRQADSEFLHQREVAVAADDQRSSDVSSRATRPPSPPISAARWHSSARIRSTSDSPRRSAPRWWVRCSPPMRGRASPSRRLRFAIPAATCRARSRSEPASSSCST